VQFVIVCVKRLVLGQISQKGSSECGEYFVDLVIAFRYNLRRWLRKIERTSLLAKFQQPFAQQLQRDTILKVIRVDVLEEFIVSCRTILLIVDNAASGCFDLGLAFLHVESFEVLDGIARFGDLYGVSHRLVEINQHLIPQQVIKLRFHGSVFGHQALEGSFLVGCIVVNVHVRENLETLHEEPDQVLKRTLLLRMGVRPQI